MIDDMAKAWVQAWGSPLGTSVGHNLMTSLIFTLLYVVIRPLIWAKCPIWGYISLKEVKPNLLTLHY